MSPASPHHPHKLPPDVTHLPRAILTARETLRQAGIDGPYALALDGIGFLSHESVHRGFYRSVPATVGSAFPPSPRLRRVRRRPHPMQASAEVDSRT